MDSIGNMANELLDFVMGLVRDPDAAARYADDPQRAIVDAHLTDVTSVDVNNLIPVVSESLSMTAPAHGMDAVSDANVWASGAATAAFDAFSDVSVPAVGPGVIDNHLGALDQVDTIDHAALPEAGLGPDTFAGFDQPFDQPLPPDDVGSAFPQDVPDVSNLDATAFGHAVVDQHLDMPGFDDPLF